MVANPQVEAAAADRARFIRSQIPPEGLFAGLQWRIALEPFRLSPAILNELESLGRVLLQFYRAVNLLYRQSAAGKQPSWIAEWLDHGKPSGLIQLQRAPHQKNLLPQVIRPDLLLTDSGLALVELDSVPGGIGLTAWLNLVYAQLDAPGESTKPSVPDSIPQQSVANSSGSHSNIIGGAYGMMRGFAGIFGQAPRVHIIVSEEAATYRPEMIWLSRQLNNPGLPLWANAAQQPQFEVHDASFTEFGDGDAVYRFFELFDLANVPNAVLIFELANQKRLILTPPPKPVFEEKMLFALLWNRNLREFWTRELGAAFFDRLQQLMPYTWLVDPAPMPPHAAIPELNITDWRQLKSLSQRQRQLILKVSGFSDKAWGARGVFLGNDLSLADWSKAVDVALSSYDQSPYVLQRFQQPALTDVSWFDFEQNRPAQMRGRVRLCPYYFVIGEGDNARTQLGGVLATICPADKKIIHGMRDAVLAPCAV